MVLEVMVENHISLNEGGLLLANSYQTYGMMVNIMVDPINRIFSMANSLIKLQNQILQLVSYIHKMVLVNHYYVQIFVDKNLFNWVELDHHNVHNLNDVLHQIS